MGMDQADTRRGRRVDTRDHDESRENKHHSKEKSRNSRREEKDHRRDWAKDKLDIDALEAEAWSAGLGAGDRGSRADGKRQAQKEEQERCEAEMRNNAFQSAYVKADEAAKALRMEQTVAVKKQENKVVFTEMEEFVWGLQLGKEAHNYDAKDVFMVEDVVAPPSSNQGQNGKNVGREEVKDVIHGEKMVDEVEEDVKPDEMMHETSLGKGLSGALKLLKDRGTLKDTVEWGGRNMDKKKSKLVGIANENDGKKEICIERTDEYGRILTPKEAFRLLSHKFHGKGPGKTKQEKRMRRYHEELKIKQTRNADTPSLMTPRVLSSHVKPGQTNIKRRSEPGDMSLPKKLKT